MTTTVAGKRPAIARPVRRALCRPGLLLAVLFILLIAGWALAPGVFAHQDPFTGVGKLKFLPPGPDHLFGTDRYGRDLFARVVHGTSLSVRAALLAVAVALVIGSLLGLIAGFVGGWLDDLLMRIVDVLLAIPSMLLSLAVVTVLGFGTINVAIAVGIASVAAFARLMRAEVLRVRRAAYVEAAFGSGVRWPGVLGRHVLPNSAGPVLALATLEFGTAMLAVSALSFLGFGAPPPSPEWGTLVAEGRNFLANAWWLTALPGLVVALLVLAASRLGRAMEREIRR